MSSNYNLDTNMIVKIELKEIILLNTLDEYLYFLENSYNLEIFLQVINLLYIGDKLKIDIL